MSSQPPNEVQQALPPPPNWNPRSDQHVDRRATLHVRLESIYKSIGMPNFAHATAAVDGAREQTQQLKSTIQNIREALDGIPAIKVALLGPSRHGKSTLLNAMTACSLLPMSDVKPCTASIVSLKRADEWGFEIRFINPKRLERERRRAVEEAKEYLTRVAEKTMGDEEPDDPRYLYTTLQRFIQLFEIDADLSPNDLVSAVESAAVPQNVSRLLGHVAKPTSTNFEKMRHSIEKYLSTKDIYWTIVGECEISGPFAEWHPSLQLIDVPGTNDTDPQRTAITNGLRQSAKAVAICTSDSNLGNDIQSWLRNSSVLGDFLEATEQSRQHLFIIRTKFDSYHPEIDQSGIEEYDEESEDRLYRDAIERHKLQQTDSYREMFRSIAAPLLPLGRKPAEQQKREEMMERVNSINVFFVSALAYEAFEGRLKATSRQKQRLSEHFNDDPAATGVPGLKQFLNEMAEGYLSDFYYDDLERQLETEVDRLVRFYRQQWTTLQAEVGGGSQAIVGLIEEIDDSVLPWLRDALDRETTLFCNQADESARDILQNMSETERNLGEAVLHHQRKWNTYYWNSLKAAARKKGVHTTCRGDFIDINQDICSVLVGGLSLSWSSFRDDVIRFSTESTVNEICSLLQTRLDEAAARVDIPEATAAIDAIVTNLTTVAGSLRDDFRRQVDSCVLELESIRKPAYDGVQELMIPTYRSIVLESGTGCQQRMRKKLCDGASTNIRQMQNRVSQIVAETISNLQQRTSHSLSQYQQTAIGQLQESMNRLKDLGKIVHREKALKQMEQIRTAALLLWEAISDACTLLIMAPESTPKPVLGLEAPIGLPSPDREESPAAPALEDASEPPLKDGVQENAPPFGMSEDAMGRLADPQDIDTGVQSQSDEPHELLKRLCDSPLFLVQKNNFGRMPPDDALVIRILGTLQRHHWKMTESALSENVGIPAFRLRGMLSAVQRILNIEGQQILHNCRISNSVELNEALLRQEFSI